MYILLIGWKYPSRQIKSIWNMETKRFFHELSDEEFKQAISEKKTYGDFMQPAWCSYPYALDWDMGCWKLTERGIRREEDCRNCDCYKPKS